MGRPSQSRNSPTSSTLNKSHSLSLLAPADVILAPRPDAIHGRNRVTRRQRDYCWRRLGKNVPEPTRSAGTPLPQSGEGSIDLARGAGMSTGRIWQGRVYSRPRGRDFVVASLIKNHVRRRD